MLFLVGAVRREAWIWVTQVGNPLAHCHEGVLYCCISSDRLAGAAGRSVPDGEDEKVTQFGFGVGDVLKARADAERLTELGTEQGGGQRGSCLEGQGQQAPRSWLRIRLCEMRQEGGVREMLEA